MWYLMYENDQKHYVEEGRGRFVSVVDHIEKETLRVTFTPTMNNNVCMATKYPLTYIYDGKTCSAQKGTYYSFSLNREVVLISNSVETPRITVRVVKLDDPKDWPAPPPEDVGRASSLPPDTSGDAVPPPSPTPPQEAYVRGTTMPFNPRDAPLPVDPAPPPAQERKKPKKRRREFYMCA